MQPNDLPIVVLPLELSDDGAAMLIEFLQDLTEALERHYAGQLLRRNQQLYPSPQPACRPHTEQSESADADPPF